MKGVLRYLEDHPAELIVLAIHQHEGRMAWLQQSVGEPIGRRSGQMTLYLREGAPGFIAAEDGSVSLKNILVPVTEVPGAQPAVDAAARVARRLNCPGGTFTLPHVGEEAEWSAVKCPELPGWQWKRATRTGDVVQGIIEAATRRKPISW